MFALGVATDGRQLAIVRVSSGAPAPGGSYRACQPCPTEQTVPLDLLGSSWDWRSAPSPVDTPPEGFSALARLCGAPPALLGNVAPLASVRAAVTWQGDAFESEFTLTLGDRLGCGGSSDVYELLSVAPPAMITGQAARGRAVVKVARTATAAMTEAFATERSALAVLAESPCRNVPEVVGYGSRMRDSKWQVLVQRPLGRSLTAWVTERVSSVPAWDAARMRRECANSVTRGVLIAIAAAHSVKRIHCDVRPSNVVIHDNYAVLVDWGSSHEEGVDSRATGVPAYANALVFTQDSFRARPAQDIAGVLYMWLCIAFNTTCVAPWLGELTRGADDAGMFAARSTWISRKCETDEDVKPIAAVIALTENSKTRSKGLLDCACDAVTEAYLRRTPVDRVRTRRGVPAAAHPG